MGEETKDELMAVVTDLCEWAEDDDDHSERLWGLAERIEKAITPPEPVPEEQDTDD